MSKFRNYVYVRVDPDAPGHPAPGSSELAATRAALKAARNAAFNVDRSNAVTERVGAAVAASGRPKLMALMRNLGPDTALIVTTLDGLGRDAADVLKTVQMAMDRRAEVHCLEISEYQGVPIFGTCMASLAAIAALDRRTAAEKNRAKGKGRSVAGGRLGRPRSLDDKTRAAVRASLAAGEKVSALARRYNTSRQTILRVRDAETL